MSSTQLILKFKTNPKKWSNLKTTNRNFSFSQIDTRTLIWVLKVLDPYTIKQYKIVKGKYMITKEPPILVENHTLNTQSII